MRISLWQYYPIPLAPIERGDQPLPNLLRMKEIRQEMSPKRRIQVGGLKWYSGSKKRPNVLVFFSVLIITCRKVIT